MITLLTVLLNHKCVPLKLKKSETLFTTITCHLGLPVICTRTHQEMR